MKKEALTDDLGHLEDKLEVLTDNMADALVLFQKIDKLLCDNGGIAADSEVHGEIKGLLLYLE